jgi:8-oxo-dGTP diphosphatase
MPHQKRYVGAYALIESAAGVLLTLKGQGPYTGTWDLPGGGIEHGEDPLTAVVREIREETNLAARSADLLDVYSFHCTHTLPDGREEDLHHLGVIYRVSVDTANPLRTGSDGLSSLGARWFARSELAGVPLAPFARRALGRAEPHETEGYR